MNMHANISQIKHEVHEENAGMFVHNLMDIEDDLAVLTLCDNGMIMRCNKACAKLFGCASNSIVWQHISTVLPQLGDVALVDGERVNPYLRFLSRVGHHFEVVGFNGVRFSSAVFFNDVEDFGRHCLRVIFQPVIQQSFQ